MKDFITYEQAIAIEQLKPVAEHYEEMLLEGIRFFTKNTIAQLTHMEINMELYELIEPYRQKDYSNYLFKKTEDLLIKLEQAQPDILKASDSMRKVAELKKLADQKITEAEAKMKERPADFDLDKVVEMLRGTCTQTVDSALEELYGMSEDDLSQSEFNEIDLQIFDCATCGWWCEIQDESENSMDERVCEDCYEIENEQE